MTFGELLDQFSGLRALVVGDLMLDEYVFGNATRISPEAPVMIVRQHSSSSVPGGAANVTRNVRALGAKSHVIGVVGNDAAGATLESELAADGEVSVIRDDSRSTTRKTRVLADSAHQVLRIDHEDDTPVSAEVQALLISRAVGAMDGADVLVLSDYLKGVLAPEVVESIIRAAQERGVPVVANPKPRSLSTFKGASLISINRAEASEALGLWHALEDERALEAATRLKEQLGVEGVLLTLGGAGMAVSGMSTEWIEAPKVEVFDTAGAGDTVIATVALGLASVGFRREVFELAARTAAAVVRKVGVACPTPEDLNAIRSG